MKKLLLVLLLFISSSVLAETWVCSYQGFGANKVVQVKFKKSGNYFIEDDGYKWIYSESANYLSMARIGTDKNGAWVFSHVINKQTGKFLKTAVTDFEVIPSRVGTCLAIK